MSDAQDPPDALSPAERGLDEHLELLRIHAPTPPAPMVARIVRAARWQRAVRRPLITVGALAGAFGDGVALLLGYRRS